MSGGPSPFGVPAWWFSGVHLATVQKGKDPQGMGRVLIRIPSIDPDGAAQMWARVAVPFAGDNYGAFMIPSAGEQVLVVFPGADVRSPVVIGALWTGANRLPESLNGDEVDRWTLTGRNGTRIAIVEQGSGQDKVEIETPNGVSATLSDSGGGGITLRTGTSTLTMDSAGVSIETSGEFSVQASTVTISASSVTVSAATSDFSGATSSASLSTSSVVSGSYSPGAGNIW